MVTFEQHTCKDGLNDRDIWPTPQNTKWPYFRLGTYASPWRGPLLLTGHSGVIPFDEFRIYFFANGDCRHQYTHPDSHIFNLQALETWLWFMFRRMKLPLLLKKGTGCTKQINWNKELKDALSDLIMKVLLLYFMMMRNGMRKRQRKQGIKSLRLISYKLFEQSKD